MVNPLALLGALPKLDGFAPLPIATMIPFMEAQSASLAYSFGLNYEFGKRKIKSMSNEDFNKMTTQDITQMANAHTKVQMDSLQNIIPQSMGLQKTIMDMHKEIELEKVDMNISLMKELPSAYFDAIFDISEKADGAIKNPVSEGSPTAGRSPGSSRTGSEQGTKNILPDRPQEGSGSRTPGTSRNPSPPKLTPEQLSEKVIKDQWAKIKQKQEFHDFQKRRGSKNQNKRIWNEHRAREAADIKKNLLVLNAQQQSHKRNFGKYVSLH